MTSNAPGTSQVAALCAALERHFDAEGNLPIEPSAWDAGFLAVGLSHHSPERAAVFGWSKPTRRERGTTHPAPHPATALLQRYRLSAYDTTQDFLTGWYPRLVEHHQALHTEEPGGLASIRHPRELAYPIGDPSDPVPEPDAPYHDVVYLSLLVQADRDLAEIASILGYNPEPFEAWALAAAGVMNDRLWDEAEGRYLHHDAATGEALPTSPAAGATPLYASVPSREQADRLARGLDGSEPERSRPELMWMLCRGLERYGCDDRADVIRERLVEGAIAGSELAAALALDLTAGR